MTIVSYAANHEDVLLWRRFAGRRRASTSMWSGPGSDASVTRLFYDGLERHRYRPGS
ncbi:MAG: hypothetical protein U1E33_08480 [Rhodospirillales bacterium]